MDKIRIFYRACPENKLNFEKGIPAWFSKKNAFLNFLKSTDFENVELTIFFDGTVESIYCDEMLNYNIIYGNYGNDKESYNGLIEYLVKCNFDDNDIIYLLEDDYLHLPNWTEILREGFTFLNADFVTLYDHPDKYTFQYKWLQTQIRITNLSHWRTIPSTTNTFSFKFKTFKIHFNIFKNYWLDHEKFLALWEQNLTLVSPIPGYSTHCLNNLLSPNRNWENEIL